ncbi:MAG: DUF1016 family protein [Bacilli bacterium]|nr:DUF1016 family protein [Bacilli bacterium]
MNYYKEIKQELINNEVYKKVKDYSKNKNDLNTYYNVGKLLSEAGKHYGEGIVKEYSKKLTIELGKGYTTSALKRMKQLYLIIQKGAPLAHQLSWSHYCELIPLNNINMINYYIKISLTQNLSKRELRTKIKNKEYERLDEITKNKLVINNEENNIEDFIKHPIVIKNKYNYQEVSEKTLKQLILEDIDNFLIELGEGFSYIKNEYKIKIGDRYNYIDLLLYNYKYNCFVVLELKITELKAEYIGQIQKYMNYIDRNIKNINQEKTIGIIICKKDNKFIMEYCSDSRIYRTTYELINN